MFDLTTFKKIGTDVFSFFNEVEKNMIKNFNTFKADIVDKGDHLLLQAELPGFDKENISIEIYGNQLTITSKQDEILEENNNNYVRQERKYGSFTRSFDIANVKTDDIKADYTNGVLTLILPKKDKNSLLSKRIDID